MRELVKGDTPQEQLSVESFVLEALKHIDWDKVEGVDIREAAYRTTIDIKQLGFKRWQDTGSFDRSQDYRRAI